MATSVLLIANVLLLSSAIPARVPQCNPATSSSPIACSAMNALHSNYYDPLSGGWRGTQFWGSGEAMQATLDYTESTGDAAFAPIIHDVITLRGKNIIELKGYGSYDDMQWWSLAFLNAGRLFNNTNYVMEGRAIFDHVISQALENATCGGGVFWSHDKTGFHYKNAITNELAIQNAVLLHKLLSADPSSDVAVNKVSSRGTARWEEEHTQMQSQQRNDEHHYLSLADSLWSWFKTSGIIDVNVGLVGDGLDIANPKNTSQCIGTGGACCPQLGACCSGYYSYNQGTRAHVYRALAYCVTVFCRHTHTLHPPKESIDTVMLLMFIYWQSSGTPQSMV